MKRVLLKLSGEALAGEKKTGFDEATVIEVAKQIRTIAEEGLEIGIVIGGGNFSDEKVKRNALGELYFQKAFSYFLATSRSPVFSASSVCTTSSATSSPCGSSGREWRYPGSSVPG